MQRSSPPPLLPLLRSRLQAEILALVLLGPEQEWSLTGLASRTGASVSSVQREITRAEQAGVVGSRRLGSTRLVKAADSPLTAPLTELLLRSFGPRQVLAEELEGVEGIERAYLFGSWAARYAGEAGRPPADLDVLVIGTPELGQVPPDTGLARRMLADAGRHLAEGPRRSEDARHRGADERGPARRRGPRREEHVHDRAGPATFCRAAEVIRRQLLEPDAAAHRRRPPGHRVGRGANCRPELPA